MPSRARFLGFAFANADFLFEVDGEGTILFAAGAASDLVQESGETLVGRPAGRLFRPSEGVKFITFSRALKDGDRAGPHKLILACGDEVNVSLFRLPENKSRISCTLARTAARAAAPSPVIDPKTGLQSRESFLGSAGAATGGDALTLIDVPGLDDLCARLDSQAADRLMASIGAAFTDAGARSAGRLSETRFGAIAPESGGPLGVAKLVKTAIAQGGGGDAVVKETLVPLQADAISEEQRLLAVRYTIDQFATRGRVVGEGDIAAAFTVMLEDTQRRLSDMTRVVGEGAFEVAYQPIVHLATGKLSHYEALTRFDNAQGTAESVKFIEALGISEGFDLAVAGKILAQVEDDDRKGVEIAFNVSGATIASPSAFGMLAGILAKRRRVAPRVLIEITETAAIHDLEGAAKAVEALRGMGYRVGLDDFGAGAASINYLHAFNIDFVKFDGGLVKKIGTSKREDALLGGLTKLCAELGVTTIAECIESEAMAKAAAALGFDKGQGRYLGAPSLDIEVDIVPGKRQGYRESWG